MSVPAQSTATMPEVFGPDLTRTQSKVRPLGFLQDETLGRFGTTSGCGTGHPMAPQRNNQSSTRKARCGKGCEIFSLFNPIYGNLARRRWNCADQREAPVTNRLKRRRRRGARARVAGVFVAASGPERLSCLPTHEKEGRGSQNEGAAASVVRRSCGGYGFNA